MNAPTMFPTRRVAADTDLLPAWMPVPGFGVLPVNSYVVHAEQPVLIDTGLAALREGFVTGLRAALDPAALRWIWITHADADHVGNLSAVLAAAPQARVVTNYLGMGKLQMQGIPPERCWLLNPGQSLDVGDRHLWAVAPPVFDAPETTAAFDARTGVLFSADCFGALLPQAFDTADEVEAGVLAQGMLGWAVVDAPWLARLDRGKWRDSLGAVARLAPRVVLSSHLPPAQGITGQLLENLSGACDAPAFVGPDQAALERMMAAA